MHMHPYDIQMLALQPTAQNPEQRNHASPTLHSAPAQLKRRNEFATTSQQMTNTQLIELAKGKQRAIPRLALTVCPTMGSMHWCNLDS